ncbi:MAG: hypothetical protein MUC72_06215 [Acidobacteria bacterium]|nr:hypothetical protein [Acidobacteriota bacterium]
MTKKKKWLRPRLIVMVRGRPEENVLLACKGSHLAGPQRPANHSCLHPAFGPCQSPAHS